MISQRFSKLVSNPEVLYEELSCEGIGEGDEWACQGERGTAEWLTRSSLVSQALARVLRQPCAYLRARDLLSCAGNVLNMRVRQEDRI